MIGHPNATAYAASKAGLIALTKGLGRELGPDGILTNAIAPSFIDTEQLRVDADDAGISLDEMRQQYRDLDCLAGAELASAAGAGAVPAPGWPDRADFRRWPHRRPLRPLGASLIAEDLGGYCTRIFRDQETGPWREPSRCTFGFHHLV